MTRFPDRIETVTSVRAIVLIVAAGLLFSVLDTSAKFLVLSGMSSPFIAWVRFSGQVLLVLVVLRSWRNPAVFTFDSLPLQLLRGLFLAGSTIFNFLALQTLQLAETTSIFFFAPMIITAIAGPLLGEWAGWRRWLAVLVGFSGVLVITRPGIVAFDIGHFWALASTLSNCLYIIMTRKLSHRETSESLIFFSALGPAILMLPTIPFTASMPSGALQWVALLMLGLFGGLGHWFLIKAYRLATTTALAPYPYLQMVWMIGLGFLVFGQLPDRWTIGGAAIIVASGLYIVHRERRLRLRYRTMATAEAAEIVRKPTGAE